VIRFLGVLYNGSGFDPQGIAANTLVTLGTTQTISGAKSLGATTFSGTVSGTAGSFSGTVTAAKIKATVDLVMPTSAPGSPEAGSIYKSAS